MSKKVFLGGTCNHSIWRDELIEFLEMDFFNPVVKDWTPDCQAEEIKQRENCDFCLYVITPKMTGVYSIAEVVDDSNKRPHKTLFAYLDKDGGDHFSTGKINSLEAVCSMVRNNGGRTFKSLSDIADYLNSLN
jgi:Nucleoside 2-deoxyribosyltransferase like